MHDTWKVAEAVIGVSSRVLLRGKPGTGKTFAATHLALRDDQEVYSVTMTEETPMAEFRGHFIQKGGDFVWHDGPGIRAWRAGARLVINEIDRSSEDILSFLYAIMDDPDHAQVTLPTGETVRPAEGFTLVATMNGVPEDLPEALQDRLPVSIEITDVNPKALERLPEDLRGPAENSGHSENGNRGISIRAWLEFAHLRESLDIDTAAQAVFGDKAKDALIAINVANVAQLPIDMDGSEITDNETDMRAYVRSWLDWWKDNMMTANAGDEEHVISSLKRTLTGYKDTVISEFTVEYSHSSKHVALLYTLPDGTIRDMNSMEEM